MGWYCQFSHFKSAQKHHWTEPLATPGDSHGAVEGWSCWGSTSRGKNCSKPHENGIFRVHADSRAWNLARILFPLHHQDHFLCQSSQIKSFLLSHRKSLFRNHHLNFLFYLTVFIFKMILQYWPAVRHTCFVSGQLFAITNKKKKLKRNRDPSCTVLASLI